MAIKGKAREEKRARKKLEIDSQKRSKFWFMRRREEQKRCIIFSKLQDVVPLGANHLTYEDLGVGRF